MIHREPCKPRIGYRRKTKAILQLAKDFLAPAVLALVTAVGCAAAGTGDYWFVTSDGVASPAKSLEACELARRAAWNGWLHGVPARTPSRCEKAPAGAFSAASECIANFNCK